MDCSDKLRFKTKVRFFIGLNSIDKSLRCRWQTRATQRLSSC